MSNASNNNKFGLNKLFETMDAIRDIRDDFQLENSALLNQKLNLMNDKMDKLNRKLDFIFGNSFLLNGKWKSL